MKKIIERVVEFPIYANLRNHRKILIVDGKTAFCGGMNIQDQSEERGTAMVRDYHFAVRGPAVLELQYTFMRDWNFMTDEGPEELLREEYFRSRAAVDDAHQRIAGRSLARLVEIRAFGSPTVAAQWALGDIGALYHGQRSLV